MLHFGLGDCGWMALGCLHDGAEVATNEADTEVDHPLPHVCVSHKPLRLPVVVHEHLPQRVLPALHLPRAYAVLVVAVA